MCSISLDFRPSCVPKTISDFLFELSTISTTSDKFSRLHDFFMVLLNDAILVLKEESEKCKPHNSFPALLLFQRLRGLKEKERKTEREGGKNGKKRDNDLDTCLLRTGGPHYAVPTRIPGDPFPSFRQRNLP